MNGPSDAAAAHRLNVQLACRTLAVEFELVMERRVHEFGRRLNARLAEGGDHDLYDLSDDRDLAQVVMLLCEAALDADEAAESS